MMAQASEFPGCNFTFKAPPGREGDVSDLRCFINFRDSQAVAQPAIVSAWKLTPEELEEVQRTGLVFLSVLGAQLYPVFLGSEEAVRRLVADYGPVWPKAPAGAPRCFGSKPGPQHQAENGCADCPFVDRCLHRSGGAG